jgi:hypothetical protein
MGAEGGIETHGHAGAAVCAESVTRSSPHAIQTQDGPFDISFVKLADNMVGSATTSVDQIGAPERGRM